MLTAAQLFQIIFGTLGGTAVGAGLTGWFGRKKIKAEAEHTLTEASTSAGAFAVGILQEQLRQNISELHALKDEAKHRDEMIDNRMKLLERSLWEHRKWDVMVIRRLQSLGVDDIDPPPEIWP